MEQLRGKQTYDKLIGCSEELLMTIIALKILKEKFSSEEDEWKLVYRKSITYLKSQMTVEQIQELIKEVKFDY